MSASGTVESAFETVNSAIICSGGTISCSGGTISCAGGTIYLGGGTNSRRYDQKPQQPQNSFLLVGYCLAANHLGKEYFD